MLANHGYRDDMLEKMSQKVYWAGKKKDVDRFVHSCEHCLSRQVIVIPRQVEHPIVATHVLERVQLDLVSVRTKANSDTETFRYFINAIDCFTKKCFTKGIT